MTDTRRFTVDPTRIVHETIDGETILISLENGVYYSLRGSGPEIWDLIVAGLSEGEATAEMQRRHADDASLVAEATRELVGELVRENLIADAGLNGNGNGNGNGHHAPAPPASQDAPAQFAAPVLQKFTDMEFFLQLDPVHEVDAAGWPHERQEEAAPEGAS
jgi:hypothetical protein